MRLRAPLQLQFFPQQLNADDELEGGGIPGIGTARSPVLPELLRGRGNAGNFSTSRASCWMMTCALKFVAICLMRSIDATVWARSCSTKERSQFQAQNSRELEPIVSGVKRQFAWTANALRTFNIDDAPHNSK